MKSTTTTLLAAGLAWALPAATSFGQELLGNIRAVRVTGTVNASVEGAAATIPVTEGMILNQNTAIVTGTDGRVVLIFSNGASISLRPGSRLSVTTFAQAQAAQAITSEEPSTSRTQLSLVQGSLVNNIRKLKTGSQYSVRTPLGAAGIRGTNLELDSKQTGQQALTELTTQQGLVGWQPNFPNTEERPVGEGMQLIAEGTLDENGNVLTYQDRLQKASVEKLKEIEQEINEVLGLFDNASNLPPPPSELVGDASTEAGPPAAPPPPQPIGSPPDLNPAVFISPA